MFEGRIKQGIPWLAEHYHDKWYTEIDTEALNMSDPDHCIIGQLSESYWNVFNRAEQEDTSLPVRLGLNCSIREHFVDNDCFIKLTSEWTEVITKLQQGEPTGV